MRPASGASTRPARRRPVRRSPVRRSPRRRSSAWIRQGARELLARFGLTDPAGRAAKTYSGDMRRRLDQDRHPIPRGATGGSRRRARRDLRGRGPRRYRAGGRGPGGDGAGQRSWGAPGRSAPARRRRSGQVGPFAVLECRREPKADRQHHHTGELYFPAPALELRKITERVCLSSGMPVGG